MFCRLMLTFFTALFNNKSSAQNKLSNSLYRKSLTIKTHANELIGDCYDLDSLRRSFIAYHIKHGI
jgi:hypothetical protein